MNNWLKYSKQSVTFRQWSGKAYAIFASLGKEITIGHIDIDVCDQSLLKDKTHNNFQFIKSDEILNLDNDDVDDLMDVTTDQYISMLQVVVNTDISSGRSLPHIIQSYFENNLLFHISEYKKIFDDFLDKKLTGNVICNFLRESFFILLSSRLVNIINHLNINRNDNSV